jgi:phosphatidylglycerol---prolipoprotein diacylglyceryl transferase
LLPVFSWEISREIVSFNSFLAIRWYSLFFASGFVIAYFVMASWMKSEDISEEGNDSLLVYAVLGTIIGARIFHVMFYDPVYYLAHPVEILLINKGGLASHGGFFGIIFTMGLFCWRNHYFSYFWLTDRAAILAIMAGGFIRMGNFFNSEIIGKPADVPWAVIFTSIDDIPRHPAQLYEAFFYFALAAFLYMIYIKSDRKVLEGRLFGLVFIIGYIFRFFIEYFKENQEPWEAGLTFNMGQILSMACIPLGIYLATGQHHKAPIFKRLISEDGYSGKNPGGFVSPGRNDGVEEKNSPEPAAQKKKKPKKPKKRKKK